MKLIIPKIACLKVEQGSLLHLQYHILVLCITWYHGRNNQLKYWNLTQTKSNPLRNCYQLQQDLLTSISTCYYLILQVLILPLNIYIYIYIYIIPSISWNLVERWCAKFSKRCWCYRFGLSEEPHSSLYSKIEALERQCDKIIWQWSGYNLLLEKGISCHLENWRFLGDRNIYKDQHQYLPI